MWPAAVEVIPVLDPSEKLAFDGMVAQLGLEDPRFVRRVGRIARPRRGVRLAMSILLWTVAPACIIIGGWTGLLMAVLAVGYASYLFAGSKVEGAQTTWWPSRKPEAPSL